MPDFGNAFSGLTADRKVTHSELVRAIRFSIAAEYEAVQLYIQLAEATDNELAKAVLKDIADEEVVHAGEFLTLLKALAPEEADFYAEGEREVREIMAEMSGASPQEENKTENGTAAAEPPLKTIGSLFGQNR